MQHTKCRCWKLDRGSTQRDAKNVPENCEISATVSAADCQLNAKPGSLKFCKAKQAQKGHFYFFSHNFLIF